MLGDGQVQACKLQHWHRDRPFEEPAECGLVVVHVHLCGSAYYLDLMPGSQLVEGPQQTSVCTHRVFPGTGGVIAHHINSVHRGMSCNLQPGESIYRMYVVFRVVDATAVPCGRSIGLDVGAGRKRGQIFPIVSGSKAQTVWDIQSVVPETFKMRPRRQWE